MQSVLVPHDFCSLAALSVGLARVRTSRAKDHAWDMGHSVRFLLVLQLTVLHGHAPRRNVRVPQFVAVTSRSRLQIWRLQWLLAASEPVAEACWVRNLLR
jgi:hypothetical protein